ncbi:MAG: hypothetical protein GQ544_00600 [Candidatus Aminicenantes bacterium]|nr:hypothetical protein [Candidatus Aminicenantes bacterium]
MTSDINIKVITRAKKTSVEKIGPDEYRIKVVSAPVKGKANKEVLKLLAGHLEIPPSRLTIVRGASSNHKVIKLHS